MGADRDNLNSLGQQADALLTEWAATMRAQKLIASDSGSRRSHSPAQPQNEMLDGVRHDDEGFVFLRSMLEAVMAAGDPFAAALGLRDAAAHLPETLPVRDRFAVVAGGVASLGLPWAVLPLARRWVRERVSGVVWSQHFPAQADTQNRVSALTELLQRHTAAGVHTVLSLTGDPVLGTRGITTEVSRLRWLAQQPAVQHLALDPQRVIAGMSPWSADADADAAARELRPLLDTVREHGVSITLQPRSYHGALLAPEILFRAFADPSFDAVDAGICLPAELPDSGVLADRLIRWSRARVRSGGTPLTVTVGPAGITGSEQIASLITGLAVPTLPTPTETDTQQLRLLTLLLGAAAKGDVRVVCATEDPHLLAVAVATAQQELPDLHHAFAVQLRSGTADALANAISAAHEQHPGVPVRLCLPITPDTEHTGLLDILVPLAAESSGADTALMKSAVFRETVHAEAVGSSEAAPDESRERTAHDTSRLRELTAPLTDEPFPATHRTQRREREWDPTERDSPLFYRAPHTDDTFDTGGLTAAVLGLTRGSTGHLVREPVGRVQPVPAVTRSGFANEPITDATVPENREWMRRRLRAAHELRQQWRTEGLELPPEPLDPVAELLAEGEQWRELRPVDRSARVRRLALGTAAARDQFFTVCAAETGAPVSVLDAEINGAIDAARSLAPQAAGLGTVRGAEFHSDRVTLVVSDAAIPLDERAEAILAALAAGTAVLCVVDASVARSTQLLCAEWEAAGLPPGLVHLVVVGVGTAADHRIRNYAADPRVDRALVLGHRDTALQLMRSRPGLRVDGRFRTLGSVAITPSAEIGTAVRETVRSAFGAGHTSANTAHVLVLLGKAARSEPLLAQLEDAVRALRVGDTVAEALGNTATDPLALTVGPLPAPPTAAMLRALTELQPGEQWLVRPEALDAEWRTWSPGVRIGVKPNSPFWADAVGVPVIGVVHARTVPEMVTLQSRLGGGSVAALFATEPSEVLPWIDGTAAARLAVGHATAPAQIERHPGGGWGDAAMGSQLLVGGPHRLLGLGSWQLREGTQSATLHLRGLSPEVQLLIETAQPELDYRTFDHVRRAALSDALAWRTTLGRHDDPIGLGVRQHLIRRRPVRTHVRQAEGAAIGDLVRVLAAALVVNAPVSVSTGEVLPRPISELLASFNIPVTIELDSAWLERMALHGPDGAADRPVVVTEPVGVRKLLGSIGSIPVSHTAHSDAEHTRRIRLISGDRVRAAEWLTGAHHIALWADPVTMAGPIELLAFLNEQAVSVNGHQYGLVSPLAEVPAWIDELDARLERP